MMELEITYEGHITVEPNYEGDHGAAIERAFDLTMQELLKLDIIDPSVRGSVSTGEVAMSCVVEAPSWDEAVARVDSTFRAALHAAGVSTPTWQAPSPNVVITFGGRNAKENIASELVDA